VVSKNLSRLSKGAQSCHPVPGLIEHFQ
jgi:hypothetical protein